MSEGNHLKWQDVAVLIVCAANMVAIFLACLPVSRSFKLLFVLYGIFQACGLMGLLVNFALEFMRSGVGAMMARRDFWMGTLTAVGLGLAVTGLFFVLSVALISPLSANRALPLRLYVTAFWVFGGLLCLWWMLQTKSADRLLVWTYPTLGVIVLALLVTISNQDRLSGRVRRKIPASRLKRGLAFFYFNGAAGGLLWLAGLFAVTELVMVAITSKFTSYVSEDDKRAYLTLGLYAFDYSLTALFIQRQFLPRRPVKVTGLLAILLAGGWALAPAIFLFFANRLSWKSVEGLQLGNVFNVCYSRDSSQLVWHEYFAWAWLIVVLAMNGNWFWRQWRNFRPPETAAPAPVVGTVD